MLKGESMSYAHEQLEGVTLETIVRQLESHFGWEEMGNRIPIRCFQSEPSLKSSLKFLRKTPWARSKVEALYIELTKSPWFNK